MISTEDRPEPSTLVLVWDWPLRIWHWLLVVSLLTAWFTPNTHVILHRYAGYIVIALIVFRVAWGFVGTRHSLFRTLPPKLRAAPSYVWGLRRGRIGRYLGLNPAGAAMLVAVLGLLSASALTGAMQVTVTFFGVRWVQDAHAYFSDAVMILVFIHVMGTIMMSSLQQENLPRSMITGQKRHVSQREFSLTLPFTENTTRERLPLGLAKRGYSGVIQHLAAGAAGSALLPDELESRLIELGFVEGARVEVLHEGIVGRDPIAVRVENVTVAVRRREAMAIIVA